jgi:exo-beta-1,3-glucanase (GH17 family)
MVKGMQNNMELITFNDLVTPSRKFHYWDKQNNTVEKTSFLWFTGILLLQLLKVALIYYILNLK